MSTLTNGSIEWESPDSAREWALQQDEKDPMKCFRSHFHIPTTDDIKSASLERSGVPDHSSESIYLCGNSLGLQPKRTAEYVSAFLTQWKTKGVLGHFVEHDDSPLAPFLHIDDHAARLMAPLVGAREHEVAMMGTLTGNLHLLMSSFYRPTRKGDGRYKIMLEGKAFPSDHFAVESQIAHHDLDPADAMILLEPTNPEIPILSTDQILKAIDEHASELALILLPGIQFYTGQYFDIKTITAHAHSHGIEIGWDCAHAVGNIDLQLHDWDVDFAVWCSYKYLNCGPGAMAGIFVHDRHGVVEMDKTKNRYRPRLSGWWGDDKSTRFAMTNKFVPRPGAAGFQLSNPSAIDLAAVVSSLQIFNEASMPKLRQRSIRLTNFMECLLTDSKLFGSHPLYTIITPRESTSRGAQLSIRLKPGLLDGVLVELKKASVVIDERKPDVIRVAPTPLYNTFADIWSFCDIFHNAIIKSNKT